jgi:glycosyltransferase involved in cell wall biosynthesis
MIARGIFDRADAICVNSPMDRDHISRFVSNDASSIWQVSNAVDPDQLSRLRRGEPGDEIQRFSEMASFKVLFVGSFIKRKGVETLVRAIKHLSTVHPEENVSLLMVGDGVEKPHIQKLIAKYGLQDKVHIIGLVNDVELAHLYASADALALPSLSEVCPTVVLEAMYFGLPVIATDIPGIRDHFKDTAWLIPPGDDEKLANAIYGLVKNPDHSEWMRKIGRDFVLRSYTWDKIARDYQLIYRQVSSMSKSVKRWMATENEERMLDKEDWEALPD